MDGRRNDQGNPAPNSDLYLLKVGGKTFQWEQVEIDPGSQLPPARTLHTAVSISQDEVFVYGGIHSATPDRVLNDGWILDTTCFEWKNAQFKSQSEEVKSSHWKRLSGKILDHPYVAAQAEVIGQGNLRRNSTGGRRMSGMAQTARSAVSGLNFETLAMAASKAVAGASMSIGGETGGETGSSRKSWKKFLAKQMTSTVKSSSKDKLGPNRGPGRFQPKDKAGLVNFEEEQFLEDILNMVTATVQGMEDETTAKGPAPRSNHSTCLYENTIVLFGGHGGFGYQRKAFNDVWTLNLDSFRWTELLCHGNPPAPRSGHVAFQKDGFVYIFGGWNGDSQFNDLFMLDVENKDWSDVDLNWGVPRWNMSAQLVEAIPSWRVFIFGGSADRHGEGRSMGRYDRELGVLDLGDERSWLTLPQPEKSQGKFERPLAREHTAMVYDAEESRLIMYGGWANKWLDDCWQISVSSIVGPPYAVVKVEPALGPITGNQKVRIYGVGFLSVPGAVILRFTGVNGKSMEVQGTIMDDEVVECSTPKAEGIGPRACEVRLAVGTKDFTTTLAKYQYFLNTVPETSLCYGPGLLQEQQAEITSRFMIQARNQAGENRKSGRDEWVVQVQYVYVNEKGKDSLRELPYEIVDFDTGQYEVRYIPEPGDLIIRVSMVDELGKPRPIRGSPFKASSIQYAKNRANEYLGPNVHSWLTQTLKSLEDFQRSTETGQGAKLNEEDVKGLIKVMNHIQDMYKNEAELIRLQDCIYETLAHIEREGVPVEKQLKNLKKVTNALSHLKGLCQSTETAIQPMVQAQSEVYKTRIADFEQALRAYHAGLKQEAYYFYRSGVELAFQRIQSVTTHLDMKTLELEDLLLIAKNFDYPEEVKESFKIMNIMREDVSSVKSLWDHEVERIRLTEAYLVKRWGAVDALQMEDDVKGNFKKLKEYKVDKRLDVYVGMQEVIKRWVIFCPLVAELLDPSMRPRHWTALVNLCRKSVDVTKIRELLLRDMWTLELYKHPQEVEEIGEQAKQEAKMEATIAKLQRIWSGVEFVYERHKGSDVMLMHLKDEDVETLEENQVQVQNMFASRFVSTFEEQVLFWQKTLASISETSTLLSEVIRTWVFLENLFIHSEEVKKELPDETERFLEIDEDVKALLRRGFEARFAKHFCCEPSIYQILEKTQQQLLMCEKALNEFMDGKRKAFPRFYFMSSADLLDVLSNGNNPARVVHHFPKFFNAIEKYDLDFPDGPGTRPHATGLHAAIGKEYVPFFEALPLVGKVEMYLERCIEAFRSTLRQFAMKDLRDYAERGCEADGQARGQWLLGVKAAQGALLIQLISWVQLVEDAFQGSDTDDEDGDPEDTRPKKVERAWRQQQELLLDLIRLTQTDLEKPARQKVMCAITLDAHNRDVQERLVTDKVISSDAFQWQSMLKSYWVLDENNEANAQMQICDARMWYAYEYLGNGPRLVVTPLTDRIYVTATQALHLNMGCAPAGPAGTGKTESTKDLANALARACYVINAAPEMDYLTLGNIFKGLAASGSWGCFDEFNRLVPEVLSVCTVQFKAVCDGLRQGLPRFILQGDEIQLDRGVGVFITMNPGYLGRSELPEGLKALFRPITVMVPDFMLIMENMFMSEGFLDAKKLALKFSTLYALNKDLLSKSNKYDWGMRAIKSVLVVAGGFKRADASLSEQAVLMRSLRDTNVAKIEGDDLKIFMGLLADLFPSVEVPRARDTEFEEIVVETMETEFGFTNDPDGYLLLKVSQLIELLEIRHSVFLMGNPGSFKSFLWKVLKSAKTKRGDKTTVVDFSPKAITTNELYGSVNMHTREWKDGILSKTMRDLGQIPDTHPKWIMLDGDLDANWIESMNSVMDDSRLLTLPSNERIPLKLHMKMIFEIRDLNYATPATATRAGIVCMSDKEGVQWKCYVKSWVKKLAYPEPVKEQLSNFFEKYCPPTLNWIRKSTKLQVPYVDISLVSSLCSLLDARLTSNNLDSLETWFAFCTIFAMGSCLAEVDGIDYRKLFSNWWKNEMKTVKYPTKGLVFDLYVRDMRLEEWANLVEPIHYRSTTPMGEITVPTTETVCLDYFMRALIEVQQPVMLIGLAGCGKTQSCTGLLKKLNPEVFMGYKMNMSYYTDSAMLQTMMEIPLEKKAGRLYAPPGKLQMIYFIDDLNMPALDKYNTQSAIELIKQKQDYSHWYDRAKIQVKDIGSTQYLCCMNPTAGSFTVNERLQRHFWTCSVQFPEQSALNVIYSTFMKGHFETLQFKVPVQEIGNWVIKAALSFHTQVSATFRKTAQNMHYEFNIRHMSGVFSGLLKAKPTEFTDAEKLVLLWIHESERIYGDRLVCQADLKKLRQLTEKISKQMFSKHNLQKYFQEKSPEPIIFAPFSKGHHSMEDGGVYDKIKDMERLSHILQEAMKDYDSTYAAMDLVLFEDAMKHVARICRIISSPSGHPLLVGVGGSGRQSLSRLSAFVCQNMTYMIVITSSYGLSDLKTDLQYMYKRAGEKDEGVMFLFTDNQIANEKFFVFFNDLLASGEITDLYPSEDKDSIRNAVRSAAKGLGIVDTPENLWSFYISRVRKNLHMSLCFSPVGDGLWSRARRFPALVNCTTIDWFQPWPEDALHNVAQKFLTKLQALGPADDPHRLAIVDFFPYSFEAVNQLSHSFIHEEKRFAYTTPKSFLELIKLYSLMLERSVFALEDKKSRLTSGLIKLRKTQEEVIILEEDLQEKAIVVKEKAEKADIFAEEIGREKTRVNTEAEKAQIEAVKCQQIAQQVAEKKEDCMRDLSEALPLVEQAEAALDVLDKKEFNELKALTRPPTDVHTVCETALHLLANLDPFVEVDKKGRVKDRSWKSVQKMMTDPGKFLLTLKGYKAYIDDGSVPAQNVEEARKLKDSLGQEFLPENMKKKSQAAGGLSEFVINIIKYYDVVCQVEPKKRSLQDATETLEKANERHREVTAMVKDLEEKLARLVAEFDQALAEKDEVMAEAERCQRKLDMAQRLVGALSANGVIWEQTVEKTAEDLIYLPGSSLVACSFAAYLGVFSREYRDSACKTFVEFLHHREVPLGREDPDPLQVLSTEAEQARWCSFGLPSDRVSLENGAVMTCSERWCLIIDPQMQGIVWIKSKEADRNLQITRMGNPRMVQVFEQAIEAGVPVLLENMLEHIDAVLQPVIARNTLKRGTKRVLKLGDKEIAYNDKFKLFMQTKLSNPHYPPEIQAECTVINFTVTEQGLEDQLLFLVVKLERPDLARNKSELIQQQNEFKVRLADLESYLLEKLAGAEGDILEDTALVFGLEDAKFTSDEVKEKVKIAQETEAKINLISQNYCPVASRGSLLFFLMMELSKMHTFYKYSLDAFVQVVTRAVSKVTLRQVRRGSKEQTMGVTSALAALEEKEREEVEPQGSDELENTLDVDEMKEEEDVEEIVELDGQALTDRVKQLEGVVTFAVYSYLRRGLLDADKLTVASMLTLKILVRAGAIQMEELNLLIRAPVDPNPPPMPDTTRSWLNEHQWAQLRGLEVLPVFKTGSHSLCNTLEQDSLGWKRWFAEEKAESADLPRECRELSSFHRLFLLRVLRPDRIGAALTQFVVDHLGPEFIEQLPFDMMQTYEESTCLTPIFFVLFPGTDPTPTIEATAHRLGLGFGNGMFNNISMGQGQEMVAINAVNKAARDGHWVVLQNIHLMQDWLKSLERVLELIEEFVHPDFRCILTSEPPSVLQGPLWPMVPEAILQKCIKIADEAPTDLKSNLRRAYAKFSQEHIEACEKPKEYKATLFALCFFHALVLGRVKFGPQGWSKKYPFNDGDLTICAQVLCNYLNNAHRLDSEVPWPDIRYIFGEIMYGGHITDQWDRRVCNTYLLTLVLPELLSNMNLAPGFKSPDASKLEYTAYQKFIEERFPPEMPQLFGLHPNAEIGFLTSQGINIFKTVQMVSGADTAAATLDLVACTPHIAKYKDDLPPDLDMVEIRGRLKEEDYTPYVITSLQESDRMNLLVGQIRSQLTELELGISGALNVTERMENLSTCLQLNRVYDSWRALAYPSLKPLGAWFQDLLSRMQQLVEWTIDRNGVLKSTWISGLFNPMAFLTAVMQVTARSKELPLDFMTNRATFLNIMDPSDVVSHPNNGVHIHGLFLEGASWEEGKGDDEGYVSDSKMKELHPEMPVANVYSVHIEEMSWENMYRCPVFITSERGATFVTQVNVRMDPDDEEIRWILAGAALVMTDD
ncbi:unnamed protein product [Cladocopium goreaui]|uniref:Dynein-1-alpha heavy chain, flagellar inner arm I1 complex, putative n=1 Tax=Cladocopium goreaui TaxID=2562237 RepID=A0A9P1D780_9DINO|nr:unnamed protein product [Cladocopium goreaui]